MEVGLAPMLPAEEARGLYCKACCKRICMKQRLLSEGRDLVRSCTNSLCSQMLG
jgi:hypothetical protein